MQTGITAWISEKLARWFFARSWAEREARALDAARHLDADEVGQRADRRRSEPHAGAAGDAAGETVPPDAGASDGPPAAGQP